MYSFPSIFKNFFLVKGFLFIFFLIGKQTSAKLDIDSLKNLCNSNTEISREKLKNLHDLAWEYNYVNIDSARKYGEVHLNMAQRFGDIEAIGNAHNLLGIIEKNSGMFEKAIPHLHRALTLFIKVGNKDGMASIYNNMGSAYYFLGNYEKGLVYYYNSLKMSTESNDSVSMAKANSNIANIYYMQGKYEKAKRYALQALSIKERQKTKGSGIAGTLNNLAAICEALQDTNGAVNYYRSALSNYLITNNKQGLATIYLNLGSLMSVRAQAFNAAKNYIDSAMILFLEQGDKENLSMALVHKGQLYLLKRNYKMAEASLNEALQLSLLTKSLATRREIYHNFAKLYEERKIFDKAYFYHKKFISLKDSLLNENINAQLADAEVKYDTYKKENEIAKLNHQKELSELRMKDKESQISRAYFLGGALALLVLVVLASALFYRKELIQKKELNFKLTQINREISEHKKVIEDKNKDIMDSISYAKRIQDALLTEEIFHSELIPRHFILHKPKDILSGDFFWSSEKGNYWYIAVADCTGHGIPGAMMSMLGIAYLNEILSTRDEISPGEMLNALQAKTIKEFSKSQTIEAIKEGMDISLLRFDLRSKQLEWAGANKPLWILKSKDNSNACIQFEPQKFPIGFNANDVRFINHSIELEKGMCIYTFTDGYADQFGGPKGKKYKYGQLQAKLNHIKDFDTELQKESLDIEINRWMQGFEQIDDMLLIGIKV